MVCGYSYVVVGRDGKKRCDTRRKCKQRNIKKNKAMLMTMENVIANNMEKYISFSIGQRRFIDSLQFLNGSLEKLVKSNDSFPIPSEYESDLNKVEL